MHETYTTTSRTRAVTGTAAPGVTGHVTAKPCKLKGVALDILPIYSMKTEATRIMTLASTSAATVRFVIICSSLSVDLCDHETMAKAIGH